MRPVDSLIEQALLRACTRARRDSPRACAMLAALKGKRLAIAVSGTPWAQRPIVIESNGDTLRLSTVTAGPAGTAGTGSTGGSAEAAEAAGAAGAAGVAGVAAGHGADATVSGAPLSLLALTRTEPDAVIRRGDVRIEGDAQIAQRFRELATLLAPDLEQELSRFTGRSVAHVMMGAFRAAGDAVRRSAWTSAQNLAEYLAHESGTLVSRHEAEHFLRGVEQAREQLDRLDARLAHLERHTSGLGGGPGPA